MPLERISPWLVVVVLTLSLASTAAAEDHCHILRSPPIPVTMIDREPVISASINGVEARFMVDTGSFFQVLYPSAAAQFKLPLQLHPGFYTSGVGGYDNPDSTTVKSFTFGSNQVPNVLFLVSGNDVSRSGIAGLLGENLFQLWDEEFDFANGAMRLVEPQHCGDNVLAYWAANQPVGSVDLQRRTMKTDTRLIGTASVNGHPIRVLFDTGSDTSMLSLETARRIGITPDSPGVVAAGTTEGIGSQLVATWIAPIAEFDIGGEKIEHTHVEIGRLHARYEDTTDSFDMLLGADFFLAHHVYLANSQSRLYFTYSGGPVFNVGSSNTAPAKGTTPSPAMTQTSTASAPASPAAADDSASPSELIRKGLAAESRGLLDQALADFTRACSLDSHDSACLYQRGMVHWHLHQPDLAVQDFDRAIQLSPDDYQTRLARAQLQLPRLGSGVKPDVDAVDRLAPQAAYVRFTLGGLYSNIGLYPQAVRQITLWIDAHPDDLHLSSALDSRCWFRAEANQGLDQALKDCNRALHLSAGDADTLDSRGLVYLRLDKPDGALADYDAALKKNPKSVTALFGRGLAELRLGEEARGQGDLAAAEKLDGGIRRFFADTGLAP